MENTTVEEVWGLIAVVAMEIVDQTLGAIVFLAWEWMLNRVVCQEDGWSMKMVMLQNWLVPDFVVWILMAIQIDHIAMHVASWIKPFRDTDRFSKFY